MENENCFYYITALSSCSTEIGGSCTRSIWGNMKKYVVFGLIAGVTISVLAVYFRKKKLAGTEFYGFFDSSTVADELFGDAFEELPDRP